MTNPILFENTAAVCPVLNPVEHRMDFFVILAAFLATVLCGAVVGELLLIYSARRRP